jgi:hypothetical protein
MTAAGEGVRANSEGRRRWRTFCLGEDQDRSAVKRALTTHLRRGLTVGVTDVRVSTLQNGGMGEPCSRAAWDG